MPNEPSEHDKPPTGFPEPPGKDPEDRTRDQDPHHVLNNPATDPDPTEWPDPYEKRPDPRDPAFDDEPFGDESHTATGATSTSEPHPDQDLVADERAEALKRDNLDE